MNVTNAGLTRLPLPITCTLCGYHNLLTSQGAAEDSHHKFALRRLARTETFSGHPASPRVQRPLKPERAPPPP